MAQIIKYLMSLDVLWTSVFRISLALIVGAITGIERGKQGRAAGMRTHMLVCLGATLTAMTGEYTYSVLEMGNDPLRIAAQVISGIGFLGMGTILVKGRFQITGLTTAAGLWATAAIGLALGIGFYSGAIVTFICAVLTVTLMSKLEYQLTKRYNRFGIYVEIKSDEFVRTTIDMLKEQYNVSAIQVTVPRSGKSGNVGIEANIHILQRKDKTSPEVLAKEIEKNDYVIYAIESI